MILQKKRLQIFRAGPSTPGQAYSSEHWVQVRVRLDFGTDTKICSGLLAKTNSAYNCGSGKFNQFFNRIESADFHEYDFNSDPRSEVAIEIQTIYAIGNLLFVVLHDESKLIIYKYSN